MSFSISAVVFILQPEKVRPNPEKKGFGVTSDVWSFGITMVSMTTLITRAVKTLGVVLNNDLTLNHQMWSLFSLQ